ncbi:MAG TPA: NAD(P)/FAD-dependent oxidoreductase [Nitrososphaeraceae archaeon]|nr:NAD(P)/FAD-dependent oxidoreductase [Nitrososphaeraceae archaeon]
MEKNLPFNNTNSEHKSINTSGLRDDQWPKNIIDESNQKHQESQEVFDVAIIGGGFSGLSAALLLGRYLRQTVIFDSGPTRNTRSKHVHAYLGFENSSPSELIQKAWKDILQYDSIKVVREKVVKAEVISDKDNNSFFILSTDLGHSIIKARYLIIATGVQDSKPNVRNFEMFEGNSAWHCPHCDGFQSINKKLAIITNGKNAISYAKEFLGWTRDITVFIQGKYELTDKDREDAETLGFKIIKDDDITEISGDENGDIKSITCQSGRLYEVDVIFYHLGYQVQNQIAVQLGCELDRDEGFIKVNSSQQTTVCNIYAVGDVDTDRHFIVFAVASGVTAAISIYEALLKDAIKNTKAGT